MYKYVLPKPIVVPLCGAEGFNYKIERLHNSISKRTKVFREFKRLESVRALMKGYEIFYNFIRVHQKIGKCPYELATGLIYFKLLQHKIFKHDYCRIYMWRLKLRLAVKNQFMGRIALKYGVSMTGYPLSYYKDEHNLYLVSAGLLFGEEKNKKKLIKDMKNDKEIIKFETSGDFIITITKQPLFTEPAYNPKIIRPNPVVINKNGFHIWDLASFDRKALEKVLAFSEKYLEAKIISFKEEKITNISFTKLMPELTDKQKKAMEIAINNGYYNYPKKVNMEKLSSIMGISYSTYQAHLKKAEGKLLPEIYKEL